MGVVMGVTAVVLGIAAALMGLILWTTLLFPRPTGGARVALESRPGRCFVRGLLLTVLLGVPAVSLMKTPHGLGKLGGWAVALPLLAALVVGLSAMAQLLGERLRALSPSMTPLGGLVRGGVTLELAAVMPFVGWFLFAPLVGLTLVGAGAAGCLNSRRADDPPQGHPPTTWAAEHEGRKTEGINERLDHTAPSVPLSVRVPAQRVDVFLVPFL